MKDTNRKKEDGHPDMSHVVVGYFPRHNHSEYGFSHVGIFDNVMDRDLFRMGLRWYSLEKALALNGSQGRVPEITGKDIGHPFAVVWEPRTHDSNWFRHLSHDYDGWHILVYPIHIENVPRTLARHTDRVIRTTGRGTRYKILEVLDELLEERPPTSSQTSLVPVP